MRRTTLAFLAVWFGLASTPLRASCAKTTLELSFAGSIVVFVGRATAQQAEARTQVLSGEARERIDTVTTFAVEQMWKGAPAKEVRVTTCGGSLGDRAFTCSSSFRFYTGSTYLVFASGEPLETSECVPTALVDRATQTLEWLAKLPATNR